MFPDAGFSDENLKRYSSASYVLIASAKFGPNRFSHNKLPKEITLKAGSPEANLIRSASHVLPLGIKAMSAEYPTHNWQANDRKKYVVSQQEARFAVRSWLCGVHSLVGFGTGLGFL